MVAFSGLVVLKSFAIEGASISGTALYKAHRHRCYVGAATTTGDRRRCESTQLALLSQQLQKLAMPGMQPESHIEVNPGQLADVLAPLPAAVLRSEPPGANYDCLGKLSARPSCQQRIAQLALVLQLACTSLKCQEHCATRRRSLSHRQL